MTHTLTVTAWKDHPYEESHFSMVVSEFIARLEARGFHGTLYLDGQASSFSPK